MESVLLGGGEPKDMFNFCPEKIGKFDFRIFFNWVGSSL